MPIPAANEPFRPGDTPDEPSNQSPELPDGFIRPAGVIFCAAVLLLESLALLAIGVWYLVNLLTSVPLSLGGSIFMAVLLFALGAGLLAVAGNLYRGYRWTRAAAFVWQLLMLTIAVPTLLSGLALPGLLMLIPPLAVLIFLFSPRVVAFTLRSGGGPPAL